MIPTKADDAAQKMYVSNIIDCFNSADADQLTRGRNWYQTAREIAIKMVDSDEPEAVMVGAGLLAAFSPQKAWYLNVRLATSAAATGEARGHFKDACAKAEKILDGQDPISVLPKDSKTWNFYLCIFDPTDPNPVCIDRHAADVATGEVNGSKDRGLSVPRRYAIFAHAYREAARQLDEIPSVVQAVTWCVQLDATADLPYRAGRSPKEG